MPVHAACSRRGISKEFLQGRQASLAAFGQTHLAHFCPETVWVQVVLKQRMRMRAVVSLWARLLLRGGGGKPLQEVEAKPFPLAAL